MSAATIQIFRDPLNPHDCETHSCAAGRRLIDWLGREYPAGFGRPVSLQLNGAPLAIADADVTLGDGDQVAILVQPIGHAVGAFLVKALVSAAISAIASIAFNLIFKPRSPSSHSLPAADKIYSISGAQNAARVGEPIPVLYGRMLTTPDYASQPYTFFDGNNQYLAQILCIGHGDFDVNDVRVGTTPVSALESDAVAWWKFGPADHLQVMGRIEAATGIMENVVTSPEVSDQEFTDPENGTPVLTGGPFVVGEPGVRGNRIELDFVFPNGLYFAANNGDMFTMYVDIRVTITPIDDAGNVVGADLEALHQFAAISTTPVRRSLTLNVPDGRYRVRVERLRNFMPNPDQTSAIISNFTWTGMKFRLLNTPGAVYGQVTLLVLRIRATNGIASQASSRITVDVTRHLRYLGFGASRPTRSPADAFVDVYCNPIYGGRRPVEEVDIPELSRISQVWANRALFDGGFSQKSTVWEALGIVLQTANAAPLPLGQLMSVAQEGTKATRRQLFSDANMIRESLAIGYSFDKPGDYDGIQVEYRDPATWNPLYAIYPPGALDVDQVQLFGCTDGTQAAQFARLLWQKRLMLRKTARFETELEGLLARMGDRIAISADLPRWGSSGVVVGVQGLVLWLDRAPDWSGSGHKLILRDQLGNPSNPLDVVRGPTANQVQLTAPAPFPLFGTGTQEPTHYAFGDSVTLVRDFTVQNMEHRDGARIAIEALAYDPAVFAGTLPWLMEPT